MEMLVQDIGNVTFISVMIDAYVSSGYGIQLLLLINELEKKANFTNSRGTR